MKGYKGFSKGLVCRGKQYAEHQTFTEEKANPCECGMHFCRTPLAPLYYYPLLDSRSDLNEYCIVESDVYKTFDDVKYCTTGLKINKKLSHMDLLSVATDYNMRYGLIIDSRNYASFDHQDSDEVNPLYFVCNGVLNFVTNNASSEIVLDASYHNMVILDQDTKIVGKSSNSKFDLIGSHSQLLLFGYSNEIIVAGDSAVIVVHGNNFRIKASGAHTKILVYGDNSKIICDGFDSRVKVYGRNNEVVIQANDCYVNTSVFNDVLLQYHCYFKEPIIATYPLYVDGETIKGNTWYTVMNGNLTDKGFVL